MTSKTQINIELLLKENPSVLSNYYQFLIAETKKEYSIYRRLLCISDFIKYVSVSKGYQKPSEVTESDLETIPLELIESFLKSKRGAKYNSLGYLFYSLNHFWSYLTNFSFTVEKGKPIFYRNAINEWVIAYPETYSLIRKYFANSKSNDEYELFSKDELLAILEFVDKEYILTLDTEKKAKNYDKNRDKYLAALALLIGTGLTVEDITSLKLSQINLKSKFVSVQNDNGTDSKIPIDDYVIPYISPYLSKRKSWWVADVNQQILFLNAYKKPVSRSFFSNIIVSINKKYPEEITSVKIRKSYQELHKKGEIN